MPIAISMYGPIYTQGPLQHAESRRSYSQALGVATSSGQMTPTELNTVGTTQVFTQPFARPYSPAAAGTINHNIFQQGPTLTRRRDTTSGTQGWITPHVTRPFIPRTSEATIITAPPQPSRLSPRNMPHTPRPPQEQSMESVNNAASRDLLKLYATQSSKYGGAAEENLHATDENIRRIA